jgi:hypothetical protein
MVTSNASGLGLKSWLMDAAGLVGLYEDSADKAVLRRYPTSGPSASGERDAQQLAQRAIVLAPAAAKDDDLARVGRRETLADLDGGRLAGAVRAEQAEASPGRISRLMPSTATTAP